MRSILNKAIHKIFISIRSAYHFVLYSLFLREFNLPEIQTDMTKEERLGLYKISKELRQGCVIVEIGSYLGASSVFLGLGAKLNNGHVFCIDTWQNDAMSEGKRDTFEEFMQNTKCVSDRITPLRGLSEDIAEDFKKEIDVLFIDGDHSYDAVKKDLENWLPKMNKKAWIVMHDSGWAEGVKRAILEFVLPIQSENPTKWPNMYAAKISYLK